MNSTHLIDAFETVMVAQGKTDFNFETAFRTWELQAGYPVINITFGGFARGVFTIRQERFLTKQNSISDTNTWYIPLNYVIESNPNFENTSFTDYFDSGNTMTLDAPFQHNASQWYIFNVQQFGYYRVNYDLANWQALIKVLNSVDFEKIHVLNRAQLVDDPVNLALSGYFDFEIVFEILNYLLREVEYTPWYSATVFIDQIYTIFGTTNKDVNVSFN